MRADDLALDVFVFPDGRILIVDEDDFEALDLSDDERRAAWNAVETIKRAVAECKSPFEQLEVSRG